MGRRKGGGLAALRHGLVNDAPSEALPWTSEASTAAYSRYSRMNGSSQQSAVRGILRLMAKSGIEFDLLTPEDQHASLPLTSAQEEELDRRLDDLEAEGPIGISPEQLRSSILRTYAYRGLSTP